MYAYTYTYINTYTYLGNYKEIRCRWPCSPFSTQHDPWEKKFSFETPVTNLLSLVLRNQARLPNFKEKKIGLRPILRGQSVVASRKEKEKKGGGEEKKERTKKK